MATMLENRTGMTTPEALRNRALNNIDIIKKYRGRPDSVDAYMKESW